MFKINIIVFVSSHIYSRQDYFLEAVADEFRDVLVDVGVGAACGSASHHRDDAVRAEIVASVVNFDEASCVEGVEGGGVGKKVGVIVFEAGYIVGKMIRDDVEDGVFMFIINNVVDDAGVDEFLFAVIDHAACRNDECVSVFAPYLVQKLSAFLVAHVCDGACVDDINVGIALCRYVPALFMKTGG